jgi:hypothetical protein
MIVEITVQGKKVLVEVDSVDDIDAVAREIEQDMTREDVPTEENLEAAMLRAEEMKEDEPGFFDKATAIADATFTTGVNAVSGMATGIPANVGAMYDLVMSGDFGTYEGARRAQQQSEQTMGRFMLKPSSELAGEYMQAVEPILGVAEAAAPAFPAGAGAAAGARQTGAPPRAPKPKANQGSVGAAQTLQDRMELEAARERMEIARRAGLEGDAAPTVGQLTRNPETQTAEGILQTQDVGRPIRDRRDRQNQALQGTIDNARYQVGRSEDGDFPELPRYDVGNVVRESLQEAADASWQRVDGAYDRARNSPEKDIEVDTQPLNDLFNSQGWRKFEIAGLTKGAINDLKTYLDELGVLDENGNLKNMTIEQLEDLRTNVGAFFDNAVGTQRKVAKAVTDTIDEALDAVEGGDLYKQARAERRRHAVEFEEHDFVNRALGTKGKTSADRIPAERITESVQQLPRDELARFKAQLLAAGPNGQAAWRQVAADVLQTIKERATNQNSRGTDGEARLKTAELGNQIARLDAAGKLELLFGKEVADQLRNVVEAARIVNQEVKGTQPNSGTAQALFNRVAAGLVDTQAPGAGNFVVRQIQNRQSRKEVERLLDGEGMLQRAAGGKQ